jgi:hypothetical protein
MKAHIKEIKDDNNRVLVAIIWVTTPDLNRETIAAARQLLDDFVEKYVSGRLHNRYHRTEWDTVGIALTFDIDNLPGIDVQI